MCKKNQKSLIREVEKISRKVLFISWFNRVHDELPKERKADDFYIRHKFQAIRELAVHNRGLRAKRILLKQLSAEYYPYMLKKRGVTKWQKVAERSTFVDKTIETHRTNRMKKLFNSWWNNVDRLGEGKSRFIMQNELNKRFQYRRVLTTLKINAESKLHMKSIINIF